MAASPDEPTVEAPDPEITRSPIVNTQTAVRTPAYTLRTMRWPLAALFGALLADLAETLVDPANSGASAKVYAAAAQHETRMIASAIFLLLSSLFIVPAVFGLTRPLVARGRVFGRVACGFALLGAMGHAALSMLYLVWIQLPKGGADRAEMLALLDRITSAGPTAIVMPLLIAFPFAFLALFGTLVRARVVTKWVLAPVVAAPLCAIFVPGPDAAATSAALGCFLVAAAWLAVALVAPARRSAPTGARSIAAGAHYSVPILRAPAAG